MLTQLKKTEILFIELGVKYEIMTINESSLDAVKGDQCITVYSRNNYSTWLFDKNGDFKSFNIWQ